MSRLMPAPSDGRAFTNYLSAGQREEALQRRLGVVNENQYRRALQTNAESVERWMSGMMAPPTLPGPRVVPIPRDM